MFMQATDKEAHGRVKEVYVDGVLLTDCVAVNATLGYAVVLETDAEGNVVPCGECGALKDKMLRGNVRVVFNDGTEDVTPCQGAARDPH